MLHKCKRTSSLMMGTNERWQEQGRDSTYWDMSEELREMMLLYNTKIKQL